MFKRTIGGVVLCCVLACVSGCSPEDMVKVDVPKAVREVTGAPAQVTLTQFRDVRDEYQQQVQAQAARKAEEAATSARASARLVAATKVRFDAQVAELQRQAVTELQALTDSATEQQATITAAQTALAQQTSATVDRIAKLDAAAQAKADTIRTVISGGLDAVAPALASAFPGAGLALPVLTGLAGLFLRRPGDAANEAQAVRTAADQAYEDGRAAAQSAELMHALRTLAVSTKGAVVVPTIAPAPSGQTGA